jgi:hypothetical protein
MMESIPSRLDLAVFILDFLVQLNGEWVLLLDFGPQLLFSSLSFFEGSDKGDVILLLIVISILNRILNLVN